MELRDTLRVLRRQWAVFLTIAALTTAGATFWSGQRPPVYEARAEVLLSTLPVKFYSPGDVQLIRSITEHKTRVQLIASKPVLRKAVLERLQGDFPAAATSDAALDEGVLALKGALSVDEQPDLNIIGLTLRDADAERAVLRVNAVAAAYEDYTREETTHSLQLMIDEIDRVKTATLEALDRIEREIPPAVTIDVEKAELESLTRRIDLMQARLLETQRAEEAARLRAADIGPLVGKPEFEVIVAPGDLPRTEASLERIRGIDVEIEERRVRSVETDPRILEALEERHRLVEKLDELRAEELRELRRVRKEALIRELRTLKQTEERAASRRAEIRAELAAAETQAEALKLRMRAPEQQEVREKRSRLETERDLHKRKLQTLETERAQIAATQAYLVGGPVKELEAAQRAREVSTTSAFRSVSFNLLIGVIVAVSAILLIEYLSTTVRTENDVRRYVNLPLFGSIPRIRKESERLIADLAPGSPLSEEFNTLATIIETYAKENDARVFMIASPMPKEGKSTVISNIAVALARGRRQVMLIDCDLRRATLHKLFNLEATPGLTEYLQAATQADAPPVRFGHVVRSTPVENLLVIPAGAPSNNPVSMLKSEAMRDLIVRARQEADIVLIDVPPVKVAVDTLVLTPQVDGTLLLVSSGETRKDSVSSAKRMIESASGRLIGCVLNKVPPQLGGYYYYTYYYQGARQHHDS